MKENIVHSYEDSQLLSYAFATEIAEEFRAQLEYWEAIAVDESVKLLLNNRRLSHECQIVWSNTYGKIYAIMNDKRSSLYAKKLFWFVKNKNVISITWLSGFFDDLLKGSLNADLDDLGISNMVGMNVEYLINKRKLTIVKKVYPRIIKSGMV